MKSEWRGVLRVVRKAGIVAAAWVGAGIINFQVKRPPFFCFLFVLQIEKKPSRRSPTKKKHRREVAGIRCFFFVGDLLVTVCSKPVKVDSPLGGGAPAGVHYIIA